MSNIMIDIETLGTDPKSVIFQIAAVEVETGDYIHQSYGPQNQLDMGRTVSAATLAFWFEQSAGRAPWPEPDNMDDRVMVSDLHRFLDSRQGAKIWGNGASFDPVLLESFFKDFGFECPWKFWDIRCFRTLKAMFKEVPVPHYSGPKHDALVDALQQTEHLKAILEHYEGTETWMILKSK